MEQRHDSLLAGKGDVETGIAAAHRIIEQARQRLYADTELFQIDQPVDELEPLSPRFRLLQSRRARALDARADEAAENAHDTSKSMPTSPAGGAPSPRRRYGSRRRRDPSSRPLRPPTSASCDRPPRAGARC